MTLLASIVTAILFGSSVQLLLGRDLLRMAIGVSMLSGAVNLFVMISGLSRGDAPIQPFADGPVSDPVTQALALTAVVIGAGVALLVIGLLYRVVLAEGTLDARRLEGAEADDEARLEEAGES